MKKLHTIVWDVDDVLNDLMGFWFLGWRQNHPECPAHYGDLKQNPPEEILGVTLESYLQSLDEFRLSASYPHMPAVKEVKEWFLRNGDRFHHVALTAVPLRAAPVSAEWVFRNFGAWIRTFHFVPSKRKDETIPGYDGDKADFLQRLGAVDLFIDDHPTHVAKAQKAGIRTLLFPRPWNQNGTAITEMLGRVQSAEM